MPDVTRPVPPRRRRRSRRTQPPCQGQEFREEAICPPPAPKPLRIAGERIHVVEMARVKMLDLKLNNVPFGESHCEVLHPGAIMVSGQIELRPGKLPTGHHYELLILTIRAAE